MSKEKIIGTSLGLGTAAIAIAMFAIYARNMQFAKGKKILGVFAILAMIAVIAAGVACSMKGNKEINAPAVLLLGSVVFGVFAAYVHHRGDLSPKTMKNCAIALISFSLLAFVLSAASLLNKEEDPTLPAKAANVTCLLTAVAGIIGFSIAVHKFKAGPEQGMLVFGAVLGGVIGVALLLTGISTVVNTCLKSSAAQPVHSPLLANSNTNLHCC